MPCVITNSELLGVSEITAGVQQLLCSKEQSRADQSGLTCGSTAPPTGLYVQLGNVKQQDEKNSGQLEELQPSPEIGLK